jgi:hypothetical protein
MKTDERVKRYMGVNSPDLRGACTARPRGSESTLQSRARTHIEGSAAPQSSLRCVGKHHHNHSYYNIHIVQLKKWVWSCSGMRVCYIIPEYLRACACILMQGARHLHLPGWFWWPPGVHRQQREHPGANYDLKMSPTDRRLHQHSQCHAGARTHTPFTSTTQHRLKNAHHHVTNTLP